MYTTSRTHIRRPMSTPRLSGRCSRPLLSQLLAPELRLSGVGGMSTRGESGIASLTLLGQVRTVISASASSRDCPPRWQTGQMAMGLVILSLPQHDGQNLGGVREVVHLSP